MLKIATRKSALALWQAEEVARLLADNGVSSELVKMSTRGDEVIDKPLAKIGGKGLFIKELQKGMFEGRADIAVHSMKDVPAEFPPGLMLAVVLPREDPSDALVSSRFPSFDALPDNARIGTCSLRRKCQLLEKRPDLEVVDLRGNVNTRLAKLDNGDFDAIVLASAGLIRLGMQSRITMPFDTEFMVPASGQGIIGIECRSEDTETREWLQPLHNSLSAVCIAAERSLNHKLGGSCSTPIASHATLSEMTLTLNALVGSPDGLEVIRSTETTDLGDIADIETATALGEKVAEDLLQRGARRIVDSIDH